MQILYFSKIHVGKKLLMYFMLFSSFISYAQSNYLKGYVINVNNDTLQGYIDYRNWGINPDRISFKNKLNENSILFTPKNIIKFKVNQDTYVGATVDMDISTLKSSKLSNEERPNLSRVTTFLQILVEGDKNLYYHQNSEHRVNFFIGNDGSFELLTFKKYIIKQGSKDLVGENNSFRGQLFKYLEDCSNIRNMVKNINYTKKSLIKLFNDNNFCTNSNAIYSVKNENIKLDLGIVSGVSSTNLNFSGTAFNDLASTEYSSSVNVFGGVFFNLNLPKNLNSWSINNELLYSSYNINGTYEDYENENINTTVFSEFDYSYIKLNTMIRYKYPSRNIQPYINIGISNGFAINDDNFKKTVSKFYADTNTKEEMAFAEGNARVYEQGFIAGIGSEINKMAFELRYEGGNGMSRLPGLGSKVTRIIALVRYKLN